VLEILEAGRDQLLPGKRFAHCRGHSRTGGRSRGKLPGVR
jgi:hypothetical protein